jgi:hypothetical protein
MSTQGQLLYRSLLEGASLDNLLYLLKERADFADTYRSLSKMLHG